MMVRVGVMVLVLLALGCSDGEQRKQPAPTPAYAAPVPNVVEADRVPLEQAAAGQLVYVPIYSHVYHFGGHPYSLESTLSVRNTDTRTPITVNVVDYYDEQGALVRSYLERPLTLGPLASASFVVGVRDIAGGVGASFLVEWVAERNVHDPMIESLMIGKMGTHGVSFARPGRVLVDEN